jgi:hypothetical protein
MTPGRRTRYGILRDVIGIVGSVVVIDPLRPLVVGR